MAFFGNVLRRLFGGGGGSFGDDPHVIYLYVKCRACREVVRVRMHRGNDLSPVDDTGGFRVRKSIVGKKCFRRIEVELEYDSKYAQTDATISGGEIVTREDWVAWEDTQTAPA